MPVRSWLAVALVCIVGIAVLASQERPQRSAQTSPPEEKGNSGVPEIQDEAWAVLAEGLRNRSSSKRLEAVKALSILQDNRRAIAFALHGLNDKNFRVRAAAASTLGELHATSAAPALRAAISAKEAAVMLAAAHALYELKDPSAYGVYYAILMGDKKSGDGLVQSQIDRLKDPKQMAEMGFQEGLGFVPYGGMGYEAYRTIKKRGDSPVRAAAARFLANDPDPVSEDALIQTALADKNQAVREAALDALAQKDDAKCTERLERDLHDKFYAVRYRTAAVIIHLGSKDEKRAAK